MSSVSRPGKSRTPGPDFESTGRKNLVRNEEGTKDTTAIARNATRRERSARRARTDHAYRARLHQQPPDHSQKAKSVATVLTKVTFRVSAESSPRTRQAATQRVERATSRRAAARRAVVDRKEHRKVAKEIEYRNANIRKSPPRKKLNEKPTPPEDAASNATNQDTVLSSAPTKGRSPPQPAERSVRLGSIKAEQESRHSPKLQQPLRIVDSTTSPPLPPTNTRKHITPEERRWPLRDRSAAPPASPSECLLGMRRQR